MSRFKEDIKQAKERMAGWWDHEIIDRPCIAYWYINPSVDSPSVHEMEEYFVPLSLTKDRDAFDSSLEFFEKTSEKIYFGGESIPRFFPRYGPGMMSAILGVEPKYQSQTLWFDKKIPVNEITSYLESIELDNNNQWYRRLMNITKIAVNRGKFDYNVATIDLGGVLDILSSFLGPTNIILTMRKNPEIIDTCRQIILEKLLKVQNDLLKIIGGASNGYNSWMNIWSPKPWYPIQCDFSALLSPKWFRRFALPDIIKQAESLDYAIYHLDGPDAFKYIDEILSVESITGIQWVPGAGRNYASHDEWLPIYKKIQNAGKAAVIYIFEKPELLGHFYKILNPKLLYSAVIFLDRIRAEFNLPKFMGGQGGQGDFRQFRRESRKNETKIN